jgi:hypothetical protein
MSNVRQHLTHPPPSLLFLIEYRLRSIEIGRLALGYTTSWDETPSISILFDGKQVIEGTATAFTNPAIESAIIHSRALLEFLGLGGKSKTELKELAARRKTDDAAVEMYGNLSKVSIQRAMSFYPGLAAEAEAALAYVVYLANKGLAHTTASFTKHDEGSHLLDIAFRGIPALVVSNFFVPLGLDPPSIALPSRKRVA